MKRKLWEGDYHVYMVNFGTGAIKAAVREDENGFASIYINEQCAPSARKKALVHELRHIINNDLSNDRPIREVENAASKKATPKAPR